MSDYENLMCHAAEIGEKIDELTSSVDRFTLIAAVFVHRWTVPGTDAHRAVTQIVEALDKSKPVVRVPKSFTPSPKVAEKPVGLRPFTAEDVEGKPLAKFLENYQLLGARGWAAMGWINGEQYWLRGGGSGGPGSLHCEGQPGTYALDEEGNTFEILVDLETTREDGLPEIRMNAIHAPQSHASFVPCTDEDWAR